MHWRSWDLNLKVRLVGETIFHTFYWMFLPFMSLHFAESFGKEWAGLLLTIPPLMGILTNLAGGRLADRIGRRPAMLAGSLLECGMLAALALSTSPWLDYLAFIGLNIASSIYWPASTAMVADLTTEEERRDVFAVFYTAMNAGVVLGPLIGSVFFFQHRPLLFAVCAGVSALYTLILYLVIKETIPDVARNARDPHVPDNLRAMWHSYRAILRDRIFSLYLTGSILIMIVFMQLDLYLAVYVDEHVPSQNLLSWGEWSLEVGGAEAFGWLVGVNGLMVVLLAVPVTRWFAGWSDRDSLVLSSLLYGLGMFAMAFTDRIWLLIGCIVILTLGELIRTPVAQSFISKYAPEDKRGQYMGASSLQFSIGRFFAPLAIGLAGWLPPVGVFGILLGCALVSAWIYIRMFRCLPAGSTPPDTPATPPGTPEESIPAPERQPEIV